ncbi:transglycosylase SLT domain-containing protein [Patescibacteria group bacterium]|nr:transglycosylase SLT domain-containing protein [Patescibacteria group bacterium]MBU1420879.1 transglycosylase SLT domain-containing protein [Patescibacteria group bacterium]MBU2456779.1 transglycosylase SLT domain-containing protein [Patescibacteria group bacterium]MBU2474651.1 transglycosylase SLT domain-containing protein [Patescibacteria group bacterium]
MLNKTIINKKIIQPYQHIINISKSGLVAIFVSARCKSKKQSKSNTDEDLRVEIDGQNFREITPDKNIQLYNVPASWNGTKLMGLKKTVVFVLRLKKGNHKITFIPYKGAKIENVEIKEFGQNVQYLSLGINKQAEDGDRRPWYTFVLVDLPLKHLAIETTIQKRLWDSDDVKIIIDGKVKRNIRGGKHKFWYLVGGILGWIVWRVIGRSKKTKVELDALLASGLHYIEFWADKMPVLHNVRLDFGEQIDFQTRAKVVWSHTRLRKEPTTKSEAIVEKINKDEQIIVLERAIKGERVRNETNDKLLSTNRWHKVEYKGKTGFIYSLALEIEREGAKTIQRIIIEKSKDFGLNPEILLALSKCESEFFPYTVSFDEKQPEIAFGVMQISGDLLNDLEDYFNLEQNIQRGISYFNDQYNKKYKDDKDRLRKSVVAYNAGPGHIEVDEPFELELYDPETKRIVNCVQGHLKKKTFKKILKSLAKIGLGLFLIFQLILFCEALFEPKNEVIFDSDINSAANLIEKENLDEEPIDPACMTSEGYMGEEFCKRYKEWAGWE